MADCLRSQGAGGGAAPLLPGPGERGNSTSSSSAPVNTPSRILAHCRGLDPEKVHRGGLPLTVGKEGNTLATRAPLNTYDFPWQIDEQLAVKKRGSRTVVVVKMMVDTRTPPPLSPSQLVALYHSCVWRHLAFPSLNTTIPASRYLWPLFRSQRMF